MPVLSLHTDSIIQQNIQPRSQITYDRRERHNQSLMSLHSVDYYQLCTYLRIPYLLRKKSRKNSGNVCGHIIIGVSSLRVSRTLD